MGRTCFPLLQGDSGADKPPVFPFGLLLGNVQFLFISCFRSLVSPPLDKTFPVQFKVRNASGSSLPGLKTADVLGHATSVTPSTQSLSDLTSPQPVFAVVAVAWRMLATSKRTRT